MLGMFRHHLASERERILAGCVGEFIHEALLEDGVLVVVHAAPETGRHMRIAHRVIDQNIRYVVAECAFRAARIEALERRRVTSILEASRRDGGEDRLPREPHVQAGHVVVGIHASRELALHDRVIRVMRHVLLARPQEFHGRTGHLLGDQDRLRDIVRSSAAAEAAAEDQLVDFALCDRQAGRFRGCSEHSLAILRARPYLAFVGGVERGRVERLHAGVSLILSAVDRLVLFRRAGDCSK